MANKKISELESRASLSLSDLMAVGDPSTGYLYKTTISDLKTLTGAGVVSFNGRFGTVNPAEGDYTLTQLGDVIITSPSNGQVLKYNGSNWVNASDVTEADTLDTVTTRGNTTANSITVGSVTAAGLSNLLGQIRTFATTGNTYIGANPGSATDAGFKLDVLGTTRLNGNTTVTGVLTGSDTIRSTNGTVTVSLSYGSTAGIIGTTSNHSLEIRTNNTYRVGVSIAGVVNIANLIGTGSRMVVADSAGNLSTQAIPDLSGYLPLSGGTLTGGLIGTTGSFASSGSGDTFAINHSSGSGIALNITKGGNGEGLYINKTSGSGNAATIIGTLNATTLVKSGGTSSQFLKADGSVDSNTYATDSSVVHISGTETITGAKTFSNVTTFNQNIVGGIIKLSQGVLLSKSAAVGTDAGFLSLIATSATGLNYINIADGDAPSYTQRFAIPNTGTYTYTFPAASGTLAFTSDIPSVAGVYLPLSGGTLTGALNGTSASFTGNFGIGISTPEQKLTVAGLILASSGSAANRQVVEMSTDGTVAYIGASYAGSSTFGDLQLRTSGQARLTIGSAGAAVFSSSVTATSFGGASNLTLQGAGADGISDGPFYRFINTTNSRQFLKQLNASSGEDTWAYNGSSWSKIATLSSTGEATFSSSVRSNSHIIVSDGSASVVLQGYINNSLRIAESGSGSSGGARGGLYAAAGDFSNTVTVGGFLNIQHSDGAIQNQINLTNNWPNTFTTSVLNFWAYYNSTNPHAVIEAGQDVSATNAGAIIFKTMLAGAAPDTKMIIKPNGNVGINTTNPGGILEARAGSGANFRVRNNGTNVLLLQNYNDTDNYRNFQIAASTIQFLTSSQGATGAFEAGRFSESGNLEIATGSIKTGEPDTGWGRAAIKIGASVSGAAFNVTRYLPVSVDGTIYYINLNSSTP